jgi:hypothetical protein
MDIIGGPQQGNLQVIASPGMARRRGKAVGTIELVADDPGPDAMRAAVRKDLHGALRGRRTAEVSALREHVAAIDSAQAVQAPAVPERTDRTGGSEGLRGGCRVRVSEAEAVRAKVDVMRRYRISRVQGTCE